MMTERERSVLIFDEVMTGFRVAFGGAQELYNIRPDLTTMGKIIGGGLPVGAYGGPKEIMDLVAPLGPMYQAGTLSGNPLAMAAGCAMLKQLARSEGRDLSAAREVERRTGGRRGGGGEGSRSCAVPQPRGIDVYLVLPAGAGDGLGFGVEIEHGGVREILSQHAG